MNTLERRFESEYTRRGYTVLRKGWPDFLIFKGITVKGVEVKSEYDCLKEHQAEMLQVLDKAGIECYVYRPTPWGGVEMVSIEAELLEHQNFRWYQANWSINWDKGRNYLLKGIDALKRNGLSDDDILVHMRVMLSGRSSEGLRKLCED